MLANDDRAVALIEVHGQRNGRELNEGQVVVFELSDGKVQTGTFIYEDPQAYADFWEE